jgi:YHS domain-containing protein
MNTHEQQPVAAKTHIDPVCHMTVEESPTAITTEYKGVTYYFCAPGCKRSFEKDPEKYLAPGGTEHAHHG